MIDLQIKDPAVPEAILGDVRLLPSMGKFKKQIERWAQTALEEISTDDSAKAS